MDGLKTNKENNVIVIGATNRPFDLDDAVLRRLPRRLLVDLPGEKEREGKPRSFHVLSAYLSELSLTHTHSSPVTIGYSPRTEILKILLRDEALAVDVDLKQLAKKTDSFSGSDLKREYIHSTHAARSVWVLGLLIVVSLSVGRLVCQRRSGRGQGTRDSAVAAVRVLFDAFAGFW